MSGPDVDGLPDGRPARYEISVEPYCLGGVEISARFISEGGGWAYLTRSSAGETVTPPGWLARLFGDTFEKRLIRAKARVTAQANMVITRQTENNAQLDTARRVIAGL